MDRRDFNSMVSMTLMGTSLLGSASIYSRLSYLRSIKPNRLKKGDTVALIAPGSPFSPELYERSVRNIESLGLRVKHSERIHLKMGFLAGSDKDRIDDIHSHFSDNEVKAIWCIRGGYGTARLLSKLDYKLIKKNPKLLIGYSDITAILNGIYCETKVIGFHGQVAGAKWSAFTRANIERLLMTNSNQLILSNSSASDKFRTIKAGVAEGILIGGNLSLLAALCGTDYLPDFKGKIVFMEDVGEKPYRIDRMLTTLLQATNIRKAAGIIFGEFSGCEAKEGDQSLTLRQTIDFWAKLLNIPVSYGSSFGHIDDQFIIPIGAKARFNAANGNITLLENVLV